jgi:hypothetical protein
MRRQWGLCLLAVSVILTGTVGYVLAARPAVQLSADPHYNAHTHSTPTILGTLQSQSAPIDLSSFVLTVDDRVIYTGDADWYLYPGSSFSSQFVDEEGRNLTWEYRQSCKHEGAFAEGRHEIRFTFRDTEGTSYGDDVSLAFFVDLTAPKIRFDGLDLYIEDGGSGAFLDPRVERRQVSVCSAELDRELCREVNRVAEGWQVECEDDQSPGLKVDIWLLSGAESDRQFVSTETVGWSVSTSPSGGKVKAHMEPHGNRHRVDPDDALQFVAYSRRLVLFGSDDVRSPHPDLVSVLKEYGTPYVFDRERRQITVYVRGPADRAGNAHPPVFSDLLTPDTGEPIGRGAAPVGTTAGWVGLDRPPASSNPTETVARGGALEQASDLQGTAQSSILSISNARVYPNPFNPFTQNTVIAFELSEPADLEITAYDWAGEFVDTVFRGSGSVGANSVEWGGQTEDGRKLGNGTYLIRVVARTQARSESVVLKSVVWNDG